MSTSDVPADARPVRIPWWERGADRLNAILVKESRQALKSRQFVMTFLLLLLAAWAVSTFGVALSGDDVEYGNVGRTFFFWYYVVLAVATVLIIPFGAHRSLLAERDHNTFDLLSITTLSPGRIVRGKLWSALVQLFIFYSAITPFMAFASLLNGFDAPTAAYVLVGSMLISALLSTAALMFATLSRQRVWQGLLSMLVLGGLGLALVFLLVGVFASTIEGERIPFEEPEFWWANGFILALALSYFVLFQQITISQLTFEADNRTTGIRLTAVAQFVLFWCCLVGPAIYFRVRSGESLPSDAVEIWSSITAVHFGVFGLFASTETEGLSHRVARGLPRNRLRRALMSPFLPGGARGYLWLLANLALLWIVSAAVQGGLVTAPTGRAIPWSGGAGAASGAPWSEHVLLMFGGVADEFTRLLNSTPGHWSRPMQLVTGMCCYLAIYIGLGAGFGRWLRRRANDLHAGHVRVITFLGLAAGVIIPLVPPMFQMPHRDRLLDLTSPITTLNRIVEGRIGNLEMGLLMAATTTVIVMNLRGLARGVREACDAR